MAIVFFDFDGTLVDESAGIYRPTPATIEAIDRLRAAGHYAVLATGRAKSYVPETGITWDGIIASNGAYAEIAGKTVYNKLMDEDIIKEVIDRSGEMGYIYVLENQDVCYSNGMDNAEFMRILRFFDIDTKNFRSIAEADKLRANKMFLSCDSEELFNKLCRTYSGRLVFGMHRGGKSCDCDMAGMSKGIGIDKIAAAAGVDMSDTYAFGDSINDYEMIKNVAHGVAMGNHRSELDEVCEKVTGTVAEEGVSVALRHYKLI